MFNLCSIYIVLKNVTQKKKITDGKTKSDQ